MLDLIIRGGTVVDGEGRPPFRADVGVEGEKITAVGNLETVEASKVVDAAGRYVTPGFIDIHTHSDLVVFANGRMESKIRQGVTTEVVGNCGEGYAPLARSAVESARREMARLGLEPTWRSMGEYLSAVEASGIAANVAAFVGHGILRECAMGFEMRPPTADEMAAMKRLLVQSMEEGAVGYTSGLIYPPSCFADAPELTDLASAMAPNGGVYASHLRNQSSTLLESVGEAIRIGEESGSAVQISHLKATGRANWGKVARVLEMVDRARERGVDVTCDRYPYIASSTGLSAMVPPWVHEGGPARLVERLKDAATRARVAEEIVQPEPTWENFGLSVGWDNIFVANCGSNSAYEGRNISDIAAERGQEVRECVFDVLIENDAHVACVLFSMGEEDVLDALRHPSVTIGSDSRSAAPYGILGKGKPHPRTYGTFPRVLAEYVRNQGALTWEDAVAKMTSRPADRLGLRGRGRVALDCFADLVVLDPSTVADQATFMEPHQYPVGIDYVLVNGSVVISQGDHTGSLPGKALKHRQ